MISLFLNRKKKLIIDCFKPRSDEIFKKLNLYKLRAKIEIKKNDLLAVGQCFNKIPSDTLSFQDPRNKNLGYRVYFNSDSASLQSNQKDYYNFVRISNLVVESEYDLIYEKSLIQNFDFDRLGCN